MARSGVWNLGKGLPLRSVATIIDVGTNRGTSDLYAAFPDAYLVLVEPVEERIPDLEKILSRHEGQYVIAAAGAVPGTATLNLETRTGLSSFLARSELTATGREIERRTVPMTTLDILYAEHGFKAPIGIKIDTEGYELEVVRGARKVLRKAAWVIAEVSVAKRFEGGYQAHEMIAAMRQDKFVVGAVINSTKRYVDLLFVPTREPPWHAMVRFAARLEREVAGRSATWRHSRIRRRLRKGSKRILPYDKRTGWGM